MSYGHLLTEYLTRVNALDDECSRWKHLAIAGVATSIAATGVVVYLLWVMYG